MHQKPITFLSRCPPYGKIRPQICLEMALASAAFDQQVNYVFLDDGVYQLLKGQNAGAIGQKTLGNAFEALILYGIENVIADKESLSKRSISISDLVIPVQLSSREQITSLIDNSQAVFNL